MSLFTPFTRLFGVEYQSYTLWLMAACGVALVLCLWGLPRKTARFDALLLGAVLGIVLARCVHVGLHWAYFKDNLAEITRLSAGGLDGRGALVGALMGVSLGARWRALALRAWQIRLALALCLLAGGAWGACWGARCAYGAEVSNMADYPAWMTWEAEDIFGIGAPRFAVQPIALFSTMGFMLVLGVVLWQAWGRQQALWWSIIGVYAISFGVGFWRGDSRLDWAGWRAEQWLDLALCAGALGVIGYERFKQRMSRETST